MYRNNKGFTLIELLVVIAIISILASIMLPVFGKARESARVVSCMSNMKQISTALQLYMDSEEDTYPTMYREAAYGISDNFGEYYQGHWSVPLGQESYFNNCTIQAQLGSYLKSTSIWKCPTDPSCDPDIKAGRRFTSYHYRHYLSMGEAPVYANVYPGNNGRAFTVMDFEKLAQTYVFSEMLPFHDARYVQEPDKPTSWQGWHPTDKMNFVFMDGHAKTMPVDRIVSLDRPNVKYMYDIHWPRVGWRQNGMTLIPMHDTDQ
ncbi:MAG: prepilin-type N-terminal cleavage/methylation domain-containing protein [Armatimonadota bacterium]